MAALGLSCRPFLAPPVRRLVGSALSSGCVRWRVRCSRRAFSGRVLVVGFACFARAARFASAWGWWCGFPLVVRRARSRGALVWAVSVPVAAPGWRAAAAPRCCPGWFVRRG